MKKKTDQQLLDEARTSYNRKHWRASTDAHLELIARGVHASQGFYGIALIHLAHGDLARARVQLLNCVRLAPNHSNAHYYLGEIALALREHDVAVARYRRALAASPKHSWARSRLAALRRDAAGAGRLTAPSTIHTRSGTVMQSTSSAVRGPAEPSRSSGTSKEPRPSVPASVRKGARRNRRFAPLAPSPVEGMLERITSLDFSGRQSLAPFAAGLLARVGLAFAIVVVGQIKPLLIVTHGRVDFSEFIAEVLFYGGGLTFLWWLRERFKPHVMLLIAGYAIAALLSLIWASRVLSFLAGPSWAFNLPELVFEWLWVSGVWLTPYILTIRTTVCSIHGGWLRITRGVIGRTVLRVPLYQIQSVTAGRSGLGFLNERGDLTFRFAASANQADVTVRGLGMINRLETLSTEITALAQDLRAGVWRPRSAAAPLTGDARAVYASGGAVRQAGAARS